jgi:hypothetical protein
MLKFHFWQKTHCSADEFMALFQLSIYSSLETRPHAINYYPH